MLRVREALGLSQRAFAARFDVSLRTLLRIEKGQAAPRGVTRSTFERVLSEARELLTPNGTTSPTQIQPTSPSTPKEEKDQDEVQETELLIQELGAWMRRTVRRRPESLEQISTGVRRLINDVEGVSAPTGTEDEQNKASPPTRAVWGATGEGG